MDSEEGRQEKSRIGTRGKTDHRDSMKGRFPYNPLIAKRRTVCKDHIDLNKMTSR